MNITFTFEFCGIFQDPCVAFCGFLRCGEFTVKQVNTVDSSVHLCVSDVIFYENYALLKLKESKTDPYTITQDWQLYMLLFVFEEISQR